MKLWIVGSNGLLGRSLMQLAPPNSLGTTKSEVDVGSLASLDAFVNQNPGITHIVNSSAFSLVDLAEIEREKAHLVNAMGPENLGEIARKIGAKLIHISTDYVFPGNVNRLISEEAEVGPVNYYGKTKLEGEERLLSVFPSACILRASCLFGSGGRNFIARLFDLFQEKEEILLADDQTNSPTHVDDLAKVILQMLNFSGLYHFSNRGTATKYRFGKAIFNFAKENGMPIKTKRLISVPSSTFPNCCPRPMFSAFDTSKIQKLLKEPIAPWEETLNAFLGSLLCSIS